MDINWGIPLVGDKIDIVLYDVEAALVEPFHDDIVAEAHRLQSVFNLYDSKSELSALNASRSMIVSEEFGEVIVLALRYCALTDGAYDITRGKQFLERKRRVPISSVGCSYKDISLTPVGKRYSVTLHHPDVIIDLGSVAKGYIADKLLAFIREYGVESVFIDARGDLVVAGEHEEMVDVQHPRADAKLHTIILRDAAVATSGDYRQYDEDYAKSHLLCDTDLCSVTVVAPNLAEADVLATAVFVSGSAAAKRILPPYAKALLMMKDGRELLINGYEQLESETMIGEHDAT